MGLVQRLGENNKAPDPVTARPHTRPSPLPHGGRGGLGEKRLKCASKAEQVAIRQKPSGRRHNDGSGKGDRGQTNACSSSKRAAKKRRKIEPQRRKPRVSTETETAGSRPSPPVDRSAA